MNTDLEDLLRSTLRTHADAVDSGPQWNGPAARPPRRWPVIAAAAAVVLAVAGATAWRVGTSNPDAAGGHSPVACNATLPAAWRAALDGPAYKIGSETPQVYGVLSDGTAVAGPEHGRYRNQVVLLRTSGAVTPLFTMPRHGEAFTTEVSDRAIILSISTARDPHATIPGGSTDIVDIDPRTHRVTHLLRDVPTGVRPATSRDTTSDGTSYAVLQGDTVYWTMDGSRSHRGVVVGYDVRSHHYRKIATYAGSNYVERDGRGVFWRGGSIPRPHLPESVAALAARTSPGRSFNDTFVVTDGAHYAWSRDRVLHWAGPDGDKDYRVNEIDTDGGVVYSVAGPYVLMFTAEDSATYHVLDTRTGAIADTGIEPGGSITSNGSMLYLIRPTAPTHYETIPVDTAKLPDLHC